MGRTEWRGDYRGRWNGDRGGGEVCSREGRQFLWRWGLPGDIWSREDVLDIKSKCRIVNSSDWNNSSLTYLGLNMKMFDL